MLYPTFGKWLADAHRPTMDLADKTCLPMTVFYHSDWLFSCASSGSKILRDKQTEQYVTWLPSSYFI